MRRLVWFALGFGGACGLGSYLAPGLRLLPWLLGPCFYGELCCSWGRGGGLWRQAPLACLGLALGFAWFYLYDGVYLQPARQADGQTAELTLQVAGYPVQTDDGCWVDGTVFLEGRPYGTRLYLQQEEALEPGDQVTVPGTAAP